MSGILQHYFVFHTDISYNIDQVRELHNTTAIDLIDDSEWEIIEALPEAEEEPIETDLDEIETENLEIDTIGLEQFVDESIGSKDILGIYLKEALNNPLLTPKEEVDLAKQMESAKRARKKLEQRPPSKTKEVNELKKIIEKGRDAREHLILANTRLVVSIAKKCQNRGLEFIDLIQEGNIGLIKAADKFDHSRENRFSTYATWWIRQGVLRAIANQGRTIRLPMGQLDRISSLFKFYNLLIQDLGREPSIEELAISLEISPKEAESLILISRHPKSLSEPVGNKGDVETALEDIIADKSSGPDEIADDNILATRIKNILGQIPFRERRVLQLRFGLLDGEPHTLEEVGKKFGITRERVRQIEAKALSKLSDYLRG